MKRLILLLGTLALVSALLIRPGGHATRKPSCTRYVLIPVEWICGNDVIWVNPDGSRVRIGSTSQLHMPRPRPVLTRPD